MLAAVHGHDRVVCEPSDSFGGRQEKLLLDALPGGSRGILAVFLAGEMSRGLAPDVRRELFVSPELQYASSIHFPSRE